MKHPKSYDSTSETRKRMSKVKLKGGKAETLLAKPFGTRDIVIGRMIRSYLALPILRFLSIVSQFLLMVSFGTGKTGKTGGRASNVIASIGLKR